MNWMPVRALGGMMWVLQPGLVHHATSSPSVSAMVESGLGVPRGRSLVDGVCKCGVSQSVGWSAMGMGMEWKIGGHTVNRVDHGSLA